MKNINKKAITLLVLTTLLMALVPAMPMASADVYSYDQEIIWGVGIKPLPPEDDLAIEVWYKGSKAYFRATIPECYDPETSYATFAFDVDDDDLADFQIQYIPNEGWKYSAMESMAWQPWVEVPSEFILTNDVGVFTLKLPMALLSETYRFGFQACRKMVYEGTPRNAQIFCSTEPGELWYDSVYKDYVHSTYYVPMNLPPLKSDSVPGNGNGLDKPIPNDNFAKGKQ